MMWTGAALLTALAAIPAVLLADVSGLGPDTCAIYPTRRARRNGT